MILPPPPHGQLKPSWEIAYVRGGNLFLGRADGKAARKLAEGADCPKWSPDGRQIAYVHRRKLVILDLASRKTRSLFDFGPVVDPEIQQFWIDWNPSRPEILTCEIGKTKAHLVSTDPSHPEVQDIFASEFGMRVGAPAHRKDGKWIALARNGDVWLASVDVSQWPKTGFVDKQSYYVDARRVASLASFNDGELGVSGRTPFWIDDLAWAKPNRLFVHLQRQFGSGVSKIGVLDLSPSQESVYNTSWFSAKVRWLPLDMVFEPRLCPDGKHLSYYRYEGIFTCDVDGRGSTLAIKAGSAYDWRPMTNR